MEKLVIHANDPAVLELCEADSLMKKLVGIVGDVEFTLRPNYFLSLIRSIVGQQISVQAASAIFNRLEVLLDHNVTAAGIVEKSEEELRKVGLSVRKVTYMKDLSEKVMQGAIKLDKLDQLDNVSIIKLLTSVKGIGKWTAEMFLIFSLGRMDVLAIDDIGIQRGAKWLYQVDQSERRNILIDKAEVWTPHFTIASIYLWEVVHLELMFTYDSIDDMDN
ncbi:DNA-3-methyladenine glycosylase family protein [Virgibacillus necropolis]|uniref:DNA-3-methyladenine glycosylase II n=1 Tax=Virgibacillus necropolis TaxID=163877 RepID=A0A221ME57_9BACI|nr:DNA-3-methyladenine glycosylase [Virgibacillus necropolis]ASN05968.1 DNA-3-methyladenine glycosidase [Virgibacillus necropolis]